AQHRRRIRTQRNRDRKRLTRRREPVIAKIERAAAMREPAHDDLVRSDDLLAVDAEILPRLVRPARDRESPGNQWSRVLRPAGLHRQAGKIDVLALPDELL